MDTFNAPLIECHERIKPYIHKTPVFTSRLLDKMAGANLFFKCENFQRMGAFKMRGAMNAILSLPKDRQQKGVVTHSSGNFAQALSLAANSVGIKAYIVMPENAPRVKMDAVKEYGGNIILCESTIDAREKKSIEIQQKYGATFIHPSNDLAVILGQGTAAKELLEEVNEIENILVPVGGGGLVAGTIIATKCCHSSCKVVGAEPFAVDDAYRSLKSGNIEKNSTTNTIADGLRTHLGDINFPIIKEGIHEIIRVEESEIIKAMKLIWQRMKIIVEPSSAVAFAALLKEKKRFKNQKIGIVLSGGNVDLEGLVF